MTDTAKHIARWSLVAGAWALVLLGAAGCTYYGDYSSFVHEPKPLVTSTEYRLAPPDVILIKSEVVKEVNGHEEQIRPDGKITLPLVGPLFVAGLTPEEVTAMLEARYREFYNAADRPLGINVHVAGYNSKKVYVFGEVSYAGAYEYDGTNTVLGTLARAQPTRLADEHRVHILRPNKDGGLVKRMTINPSDMAHKGDTSLDAVLEVGDVMYVPPGPLAEVGLLLQQILLPIQPAAATVQSPAKFYGAVHGAPYSGGGSGGSNP